MKKTDIRFLFAKYVSLNIIGMIGLSCYILADTFFVARGIGAEGLTALNLAIPIYSFIHGSGLLIGMGGATRFAISRSKTVFSQALWFAFIAACVFVAAGIFLSYRLALVLGADSAILDDTHIYLKTILCLSPLFLLNNIVICFVRNDGSPHLAMLAMLLGSLSNVVLDYIFIFPCGMGMFGAALATAMAPVISLLIMSRHFLKKQNTFHIVKTKIRFKVLADISALGFSALITEFSSGIVIIVLNLIILNLAGNLGVAAYGIITNLALVVIAVFTGIAQGMQPIVSRAYSLGQRDDLRKLLKYGFVTAVCIAAAVYLFSFIFTEPMVAAFNKDGDLQLARIAENGIRIYFLCFGFAGINVLSAAYFCAVDTPRYGMIISVLRGFAVIIPAAVCLAALFGLTGVWLAMPFAELLVMVFTVCLLKKNNKQLTENSN
ncbi:MAG: MATE family efflux transporter [Bacillota bacterium]